MFLRCLWSPHKFLYINRSVKYSVPVCVCVYHPCPYVKCRHSLFLFYFSLRRCCFLYQFVIFKYFSLCFLLFCSIFRRCLHYSTRTRTPTTIHWNTRTSHHQQQQRISSLLPITGTSAWFFFSVENPKLCAHVLAFESRKPFSVWFFSSLWRVVCRSLQRFTRLFCSKSYFYFQFFVCVESATQVAYTIQFE